MDQQVLNFEIINHSLYDMKLMHNISINLDQQVSIFEIINPSLYDMNLFYKQMLIKEKNYM